MRCKSEILRLFCIAGILATATTISCSRQDPEEARPKILRVLAWVGYDEAEFLNPLEKELGLKIEVKTYVGGDQMYSLFRAAPPGTYDLVVVDAEYGERMYKENLLSHIDRELWYAPDLFLPFSNGDPVKLGDKVYAVVVRWGALGIVYNRTHLTPERARSYNVLWSPQVKGKVGIFDWYLPTMGVLSRYLGNPNPYDLDSAGLKQLKETLLKLRPQVRAIHPNTGDVINDLRTGQAWLIPGIGEWAAAVLAEEGRAIDWTIPAEGGVMWVEAFAIPASTKNATWAKRFLESVRRPEHLARLAWRKAYHSQVVRREAYEKMTADQRKLLKAESLPDLQEMMNRLTIRKLPGPRTTEREWLQVWTEFKAR